MSPPRLGVSVAALVVAAGITSGCSGSEDGGRTQVEFFQFKGEAVATFDKLIAQFGPTRVTSPWYFSPMPFIRT